MDVRRPTPEELLARAKEEEIPQRGKLKIYLGAAPGVGKTYTMLEDALAKRAQGLDVVAGLVESHGRKEIEAMLQGLVTLPRHIVEYHGKSLLEFDLDGALKRAPALILMDEMAHTNVPGLRHAKRWQDIKELIDRGIDVYTTLNVQHIESLNDDITQIIGIKVRETVPDSLLEMADSIELIDLPPDDLLKRLQEGKVYFPTQAELATQHFFRKGNLIALRELALRFTAAHVDQQVLSYRRGKGIEQTWPVTERLLVCVGSETRSAKVIRAARRLAKSMHADWIAVHVETPQLKLSDEQRNNAVQNLRLAEQLGAETRILSGLDVITEIMKFAHQKNVTKIIIGKQVRPPWRDFLFGSLVDELVRHSGDIDIYIIRGEGDAPKFVKSTPSKRSFQWGTYGLAALTVFAITIVNLVVFPFVGLSNLMMMYLLGVIVISLYGGAGPSLFASILSVLTYAYIFVPSVFTSMLSDFQYIITLIALLLISQIIVRVTTVNRQQAEIAQSGEQRAIALHALTRQLAIARGSNKLLEIAVRHISEVFQSEVQALLPENKQLQTRAGAPSKKILSPKDQGVAQWVYDLGQIAGLGTDTLPNSDAVYVPLLGSSGPVGVLKVTPRQPEKLLIPEQIHLLEACANQVALALEVDRLHEKAKETQTAIETERLRNALFTSLSHELQGPLSVIIKRLDKFADQKSDHDPKSTRELILDISYETERLNKLINNLLQITQLEEGKIKLHKKRYALDELIKTTLNRIEKKLNKKPCVVKLSPELPTIPFDKVLMEQVFVNLIENAILYTPPDSPIEISALLEEDSVLLSVADRGPGLMMKDVDKVFEKFYRGQTASNESGAGLGLSVCQSIIKAHGGRVWAENRTDGGAIFYFILPLHEEGKH